MDSLNRLNVYKVTIEWVALRKKYWIVTRVPWVIAPEYVHHLKGNMQAVLTVIADRGG